MADAELPADRPADDAAATAADHRPGRPAEHLVVVTTTDGGDEARALAASAVEARVAACVQVEGPVSSVYRWEGEATADEEWRLMFKTTAARYAALEAHIKERHSYDVPEIVALPVAHGSAEYLRWVDEETRD